MSSNELKWDGIVFGHLFWNRYFGETKENPPRGIPSTCSSVLLRGKDKNGKNFCLVLDPSTRKCPQDYYFDINRRTGLKPADITHCFTSHEHFDHWHGLAYFPNAKWFCGTGNKVLIKEASMQAKDSKREGGDGLPPEIDTDKLEEAEGEFLPGINIVYLPGHTKNLCGISFKSCGKKIIFASDAVMTSGHFKDRITEYQEDESLKKKASETIERIAANYDIVIPGHDNLIVCGGVG